MASGGRLYEKVYVRIGPEVLPESTSRSEDAAQPVFTGEHAQASPAGRANAIV